MSATEEALIRLADMTKRLVEFTVRLKANRMRRPSQCEDTSNALTSLPAVPTSDKFA